MSITIQYFTSNCNKYNKKLFNMKIPLFHLNNTISEKVEILLYKFIYTYATIPFISSES